MQPVISLVGRPNVGKSTLFNRLTRSRDALVANQPGLTRDRKYGVGKMGDRGYIVVDTGGLSGDEAGIDGAMAEQTLLAIDESDIALFMVDGRAGLNATDEAIAKFLRQNGKNVVLVVNKTDGIDEDMACTDFYALGLGQPHPIAASQGRGVAALVSEVLGNLPIADEADVEDEDSGIRVAVVGRPNVGKSTLVNRLLGEDRVVVFDLPGTTRDSIHIPFERDGTRYTLIDTAGVRRRARIKEAVEKFSVIKTIQALQDAHVVIVVLDAQQGISDQDASLLGMVLDSGRAVLIALNKWDNLSQDMRDRAKRDLDVRLSFIDYAKIHTISALHGTGVGDLLRTVNVAYKSAMRDMATPMLTRILEDALQAHQPPLSGGGRAKLRYAHQGGKNPPLIIIHGSRTSKIPAAYTRYLANIYRKALKLLGTPIRIEYKEGKNPYEGRKNKLTPSQERKRKRMVKHVKRK